MEMLSRRLVPGPSGAGPRERVLQIGEGKFIRGFVDWLLQELGRQHLFDGTVVLTPARATGKPKIEALRAQDGLFTVWTRGIEDGREVDRTDLVSSITRVVDPFENWQAFLRCAEDRAIEIVVSNTTELGITYVPTPRPTDTAPATFPARLAAYLAHRFTHLDGDPEAGMVILPTELIDDNATMLREIVLRHAADWDLGTNFAAWLAEHNAFCNTLVDRIVPGPPDDPWEVYERLGYTDTQVIMAEPFYLWAIEADERAMQRLPFGRSTLNVRYTDDLAPYRIQKLRVLNGTHTFLAPLGLLLGCATVREAITHPVLGPAVRSVLDEVIVRYSELDEETLRAYARTVLDRFLNPYIAHHLRDITLNALTKFRIRLLPVLARYAAADGQAPANLALSLAALLSLYRPGSPVRAVDDSPTAALATEHWEQAGDAGAAIRALLADERIWGQDLTAVPGLSDTVSSGVAAIEAGLLATVLAEQN